MNEKHLTRKERISFPIATFGRSGIYTTMSMFLLIFYTEAAKLDPIHAGIIILIGRIFDAVNDPIMGIIIDRTNTRWGKMRPFLLYSPVPIAITTAAMFYAPCSDSYLFNYSYALITYLLWAAAFTVQDVPHWGLCSVITPNEGERTSFLSNARLGSTAGGILPTIIVPILTASKLGLRKGYFVSAVIFGALGCVLSSLAFFTTKERIQQSYVKRFGIKDTLKLVVKNKVLLIVIISSILGSTMVMANVAASYIHYYLIGVDNYGIIPDGLKMTSLTIAVGVGMVPAMLVLPLLRRRFSLKAIYICSSIFGAVVHIAFWFIGYSNIYTVLVCLAFMGLPLGIYNVITYALIADSVDYIEWKTNMRLDGICFSFQTLLSQITAGIATFSMSITLKYSGFLQPLNGIRLQQSDSTRSWLLFMVSLLPAIGFLLTCVPMLFNDYSGKKKDKILMELAQRRIASKSKNNQ